MDGSVDLADVTVDVAGALEQISFEDEVVAAMGRERDPAFADVDDDALEQALRVQAAEIAAATCRWLLVLAEVVVWGIWAHQGARTPTQWLSWAVSMGTSTAREHVRVALRLADFPATTERFSRGELSYTKVRAITRLNCPALEDLLLTYADAATGAQLEDIVRRIQGVERARGQEGISVRDLRDVDWASRADGMLEVRMRLTTEDGAAFVQTIDRRVDQLRRERRPDADAGADDPGIDADHGDRDDESREPVGALRADAVGDAVRALAAGGVADTSGADEHTVVVHVDAATLAEPDEEGADRAVAVRASAGARVPAMSARALRRIACDARLAIVGHGEDGDPVCVSGTTRKVPTRLRRALVARDGGCRFPGCRTERGLHAHHIVHWADGGPTELSNLVLLCRFHHTFVHDAGWTIIHDGRGHVRFAPPGRPVIPAVAALPTVDATAVVERNRDHDLDPPPDRVLEPDGYQPRPDYDQAIALLYHELERAIDRTQPPAPADTIAA